MLATGRLRNRRSISGSSTRFSISPERLDLLWGPSACYTVGGGATSLGVKRPESEADHSPPFSARLKMVVLYLHSPIGLHGVMSI
jgi:hypothetical protein